MGNLVKCVHCGYRVSQSAKHCPRCGSERFNPASYVVCISCGGRVHSDDASCGNCGETDFKGVQCVHCGDRLRARDGWSNRVRSVADGSTHTNHHHFSCLERYFSPPGRQRCRDCGNRLPSLTALGLLRIEARVESCSKCGCQGPYSIPDWTHSCFICGLSIYEFQDGVAKRGEDTQFAQHKFHFSRRRFWSFGWR
jgi:RNA polymerase subunit RPABC4/transcription elongation factor Spt4